MFGRCSTLKLSAIHCWKYQIFLLWQLFVRRTASRVSSTIHLPALLSSGKQPPSCQLHCTPIVQPHASIESDDQLLHQVSCRLSAVTEQYLAVCDADLAAVCRPAELGIDVVIESATKYLNGHADLIAGAVAGSTEFMRKVGHVNVVLVSCYAGTLFVHAAHVPHSVSLVTRCDSGMCFRLCTKLYSQAQDLHQSC